MLPLGITSSKKSKVSFSQMTLWMSDLCKVLRLSQLAWKAALCVSSVMNIWHASAKRMGASEEIIRTSSSDFIIFLIRARGNSWALKALSSEAWSSIFERILSNFIVSSLLWTRWCSSTDWFCKGWFWAWACSKGGGRFCWSAGAKMAWGG